MNLFISFFHGVLENGNEYAVTSLLRRDIQMKIETKADYLISDLLQVLKEI